MKITPDATRSFGVIFCTVLIFALGFILGMAAWDKAPPSSTDSWLYRWQTLIGAFVALIAAGIGAWFINKQIATARRIEEEKRQLRQTAIRAVLPLSLSELCDYAMRSSARLKELHEACNDQILDQHSDVDRSFPQLPKEVSSIFRDFIECSTAPQARPLIDILSMIQVQSSRFRSIEAHHDEAELLTQHYIEALIIENAELYARSAAVFEFARFKSDTCEFVDQNKAVNQAIWFFRLSDDIRYTQMRASVQRLYT